MRQPETHTLGDGAGLQGWGAFDGEAWVDVYASTYLTAITNTEMNMNAWWGSLTA